MAQSYLLEAIVEFSENASFVVHFAVESVLVVVGDSLA